MNLKQIAAQDLIREFGTDEIHEMPRFSIVGEHTLTSGTSLSIASFGETKVHCNAWSLNDDTYFLVYDGCSDQYSHVIYMIKGQSRTLLARAKPKDLEVKVTARYRNVFRYSYGKLCHGEFFELVDERKFIWLRIGNEYADNNELQSYYLWHSGKDLPL